MFGIDDAILWPMVFGALTGGATSKDPLKGALIGGGLGAAGGGLLGGAGEATAGGTLLGVNPAAAAPGFNASGFLGSSPAVQASQGLLGAAPLTQSAAPVVDMGASAGLLDKANFATGNAFSPGGLVEKANQVAKPVGTAMSVANMFTPPPEQPTPITPSPFTQQNQTGPQAGLQNVVAGTQQMDFQQQQKDALERAKRKRQIAGIGMY